jgi:hypothetical protein
MAATRPKNVALNRDGAREREREIRKMREGEIERELERERDRENKRDKSPVICYIIKRPIDDTCRQRL